MGEYDKSIIYLNTIANRYNGNNKEIEARLIGGLARNYFKLGLNSKAIELWKKAIEIIVNSNNSPYLKSVFRNNMAVALIDLGDSENAQKILLKSLEDFPLTETYQKLSDLVLDNGANFELSKSYLNMGLALVGDALGKSKPYINDTYLADLQRAHIMEGFAYHYLVKGDYDKSLNKYGEALSIAERINRVNLQIELYRKIGYLHQKTGNLEESTEYLSNYIILNDSLRLAKNKSLSIPLRNFILEKVEDKNGGISLYNNYKVLVISIIALLGFLSINSHIKDNRNSESINNIKNGGNKSIKVKLPPKTESLLSEKIKEFEMSNDFLDENMSLSRLVDRLETNVKYLRQYLKTHKNSDYNSYINELRINYIVEKLQAEPKYLNYKIGYLAQECGFSSHSKFSASFKKTTGISPSNFISNLKNNHA
ncbi:helix-turn-helix domain-containing protein [Gelidibacter maritimus]|uniref:Helix-turn-helix domain-containing protein n=1 Tax=Gelidibacter maritimus TaxID=2761487 RepID=A0A7W2M8I5_9FLAO|nr:helix-turn-helix domain-containing protein [Gelidibacter maritimus]MBA6154650.1 helix-turn-helix domain-containing protein [Gelidibacter maritimus]